MTSVLRTCRVCKKSYDPLRNSPTACRFHPATWTGAERSKLYGRIDEPGHTGRVLNLRGTEYFFDCCDAKTSDAPGCSFAYHLGYDE